jgi:hypothetical protein
MLSWVKVRVPPFPRVIFVILFRVPLVVSLPFTVGVLPSLSAGVAEVVIYAPRGMTAGKVSETVRPLAT